MASTDPCEGFLGIATVMFAEVSPIQRRPLYRFLFLCRGSYFEVRRSVQLSYGRRK